MNACCKYTALVYACYIHTYNYFIIVSLPYKLHITYEIEWNHSLRIMRDFFGYIYTVHYYLKQSLCPSLVKKYVTFSLYTAKKSYQNVQ